MKHLTDIPEYSQSRVIFNGDYIDGNGVNESDKVVDFIFNEYLEHNAVVLPGNHELLLYKYVYGTQDDKKLYYMNGGKRTIKAFLKEGTRGLEANKQALKNSKYFYQLMDIMGNCFDTQDTVVCFETPTISVVHAGYSYEAQEVADYHETSLWDSLWTREDYFFGYNTKYHNDNHFARNIFGKTVIVGHTPTCLLLGVLPNGKVLHYNYDILNSNLDCPIVKSQYEGEPARYFIDGGSHGATNSLNVLLIDDKTLETKYYKLTPEGAYAVEQKEGS